MYGMDSVAINKLYDLSIAGATGEFPKTKLANALSIYSAIRDHNIDPNKLLFCKDASGKKVISVEAIGLFADTDQYSFTQAAQKICTEPRFRLK